MYPTKHHHRCAWAGDPLCRGRRTLYTRSCLLAWRQQQQPLELFASDEHVALEVIWRVYKNMADTYRKQAVRGKGLDASRN